jgi:hypothetical protein
MTEIYGVSNMDNLIRISWNALFNFLSHYIQNTLNIRQNFQKIIYALGANVRSVV